MKQLYLDGLYRKTKKLDVSFCSPEASKRVEKIKMYQKLRFEGCTEDTALKAIEMSRATYFRWKKALAEKGPKGLEKGSRRPKAVRQKQWTKDLQLAIYRIRVANPIWGRLKIHAVLLRDFPELNAVSVTTVGRILGQLVELKRILPAWVLTASKRSRRKRKFDKYAKRWKYGMKAKRPGELIQLDHMSVSLDTSKTLKHFQATCPISKITVVQAYSQATSLIAAKFLQQIKAQMPFPVLSIQVDGGSEFMKDFEAACEAENIALYVLPPKSPKYNGCVERRNATFKYEFYYQYAGDDSMEAIRAALQLYQNRYNTFRPHQALNQDTPLGYYKKNHAMAA
jgi:putative transposase